MKRKLHPNYFAFLVIGMALVVLGISIEDSPQPAFILAGILFMIVSFILRKEWKKRIKK